MLDINEYIQRSKEQRQAHLQLTLPCIERGGDSWIMRGLLAHVLDTTIPNTRTIHVCHACHNGRCGNPYHLYWGTAKENRHDAVENGELTAWQRTVLKYGEATAREMQKRNANPSKAGKGNKGKPKTDEHKAKIAASVKARKSVYGGMVDTVGSEPASTKSVSSNLTTRTK